MSENHQDGSQPTVVLVHGAWADGSSWNEVIKRLQAEGLQVTAPANPLRGISIDSAYIGSICKPVHAPATRELSLVMSRWAVRVRPSASFFRISKPIVQ